MKLPCVCVRAFIYLFICFIVGDFFKDSLPSADLFVLGHVIHDWDRANVDALLKNVFENLPPGTSQSLKIH